ncbi:NAD(P)H-dependent oxidoreductase [Paracoccus nototheniae]|uniref:NAD(P)H-dependent oxidoreductase n=1 Tax=Paracoccus nototheniae TaxID=2489002 RepID=A0ABW4E2H2_9RHOB
MKRNITIVIGHPDPAPDRFCRALARSYADGAREAGHNVRTVDVAVLEVPYLRTAWEFKQAAPPRSLTASAQAVFDADHLVLVFPLWLGGPPALLKAFLEQVMRPGQAFTYGGKSSTSRFSRRRSARLIVTMGMPGCR